AVRILLNGIFVVVFAGIAMGMTGFIVKSFVIDGGGVIEDGQLTVVVRDFVWSRQFFSILIVGFISILFHLKSATLASNLSGALDGPGAAAAVVTAGMMAAGGAKAASLIGARALGGAAANAGKKGLSAAADRASDIVKNWGKKGSSTP
ncbi:MAG: hypothetical protein LPK88_11150, partial [Alphaproteobacteria bacterium]|nr:hypothetical protein [Alphaproteobacteria bacterium]